jgi:hypothetical protein
MKCLNDQHTLGRQAMPFLAKNLVTTHWPGQL